MNIIVKTIFGSHLYGTNTPESDMDFKGVFMPQRDEIFLGKIPKSVHDNTKVNNSRKNTKDDIDCEIYSLHYFIDLACQGETVALDMLHAPNTMLLETSPIWGKIVENRHRFYTKNLKAFIGYARRQAAKYGIKGSRLNDAERVARYLWGAGSFRLKDIWDNLPTGEHIFKLPCNENGERIYEVCGKKINENAFALYAFDIVDRFRKAYGERARQAASNEGIDWKAVSHAFRAAYQVKEILTEGNIHFPLREADYLKQIKAGAWDFQNVISPHLDRLIEEIEQLSQKSELPMHVDRNFWDQFIINEVKEVL